MGLGLGLHHQDFLPKSLSTHEEVFFRRYRRDIGEAPFCAFWRQALPRTPAMLGPRSTKRCKYRENCCAERWAVVLSVLLLLWLARVLRGPCFFRVGFRAFWQELFNFQLQKLAQSKMHFSLQKAKNKKSGTNCQLNFQNDANCLHERLQKARARPQVFCCCSFWAAVSGASGVCVRDPMSAFWVGAGWGPESWHPRHHLGLGWATCIT